MKAQLDREFMHARWPTMVRLAYGLTGDLGRLSWKAYDSTGAVVWSGREAVPPPSS